MNLQAKVRDVQRKGLDWLVGHLPKIGLEQRAENFVWHFQDFIPPSAKVLDIGGGWGFYVDPLQRARQCEVTVLDVVEPGFRKVPVVTYEGTKIPFPDQSFDVSILITVLHHVPVPEKVLAEAKRVSRRFVIVVEDLYHHFWGRVWTVMRDTFYTLEFFGHPRQFRRKEDWFRCFESLGFRVESEHEIYTSLLGIRILNGIFVLSHAHG